MAAKYRPALGVRAWPGLSATAHVDGQTQTRRGGGADHAQQGGLERIAADRLVDDAALVASEAIALA